MPVNKYNIIALLLMACSSCIEPFEPVILEIQEVLVIDGMISDRPGDYQVSISVSSPYNNPGFRPVDGCVVSVEDDLGNIQFYDNVGGGQYSAFLEPPFLAVGKVYSLQVRTPNNQTYRSQYDTLLACPPVESLYYFPQSSGGTDPDDSWNGVQFYNDVRGSVNGTRNYRWKAIATWEYQSPYTANYVRYQGLNIPYIEDTVSICYLTESIERVFSASTQLLTENSIFQNQLHYVSDQTPRLTRRYSLLLEQHSLTDQAFSYWEKIAAQSANDGGLYETQPSSSQGNLYNIQRPREKVLGCFYATQIQEERIYVDKDDLEFSVAAYTCRLDTLYNNSTFAYDRYYYLISLAVIGPGPPWLDGLLKCFDCTERGGDNERPEYWIDE
jgi:hypothetical protein